MTRDGLTMTLAGVGVALACVAGVLWAGSTRTGAVVVASDPLLATSAVAQGTSPGGPAVTRPRGQYLLLAGRMQGSPPGVVWVIDTVNRELLALKWNRSERRLEPFDIRNLNRDTTGAGPSRGR